MVKVNPERIHLIRQDGNFRYAGNIYYGNDWRSNHLGMYTFGYSRPFFRRHSVSFGAHGIAILGPVMDEEARAKGHDIAITGDIIKDSSSLASPRNFHFGYSADSSELLDSAEASLSLLPEESLHTILRGAVAEAIHEYSTRQSLLFGVGKAALTSQEV